MKIFVLLSFLCLTLNPSEINEPISVTADRTVIYRCSDGTIHIVKEKSANPCGSQYNVVVKIVMNEVASPEVVKQVERMSYKELHKLELQMETKLNRIDKQYAVDKNALASSAKNQSKNLQTNKAFSRVQLSKKSDYQQAAIDNCPCGDGAVASCPRLKTCEECCAQVEIVKKALEDLSK